MDVTLASQADLIALGALPVTLPAKRKRNRYPARVRPPRAAHGKYCSCGSCEVCYAKEQARKARAAKVGCTCGCRNCDCAEWGRKYEAKHGAEERAYYAEDLLRFGSSLANPDPPDLDDLYDVARGK